MTGPEHFREAERLLAESASPDSTNPFLQAQRALVHAELARTAAYALAQPICEAKNSTGHPSREHYEDWVDVIELTDDSENGAAGT